MKTDLDKLNHLREVVEETFGRNPQNLKQMLKRNYHILINSRIQCPQGFECMVYMFAPTTDINPCSGKFRHSCFSIQSESD